MRSASIGIAAALVAMARVGAAWGQVPTGPTIEQLERALVDPAADVAATPAALRRLAAAYLDAAQTALRVEGEASGGQAGLRACAALAYRYHVVVHPSVDGQIDARDGLAHALRALDLTDDAARVDLSRVCPSRHPYTPASPIEWPAGAPPACPRLVEWVRARHPEVIAPTAPSAGPGEALRGCSVQLRDAQPMTVDARLPATPTVESCFDGCAPLQGDGANPVWVPEAWSALGDYFFQTSRGDSGNALAIDAYRRARSGFSAMTTAGSAPHPWLARAGYQIGRAYYRIMGAYPRAMQSFAAVADEAERSPPDERLDHAAIEWMSVILSDDEWVPGQGEDHTRCQPLIEAVAAPSELAMRPFSCSGIVRLTAPRDPLEMLRAVDPRDAAVAMGAEVVAPLERQWTADLYYRLARRYGEIGSTYTAITAYRLAIHVFPLHPWSVEAAWRVVELYRSEGDRGAVRAAVELAAYFDALRSRNALDPETADRFAAFSREAPRNARLMFAVERAQFAERIVRRLDARRPCLANGPCASPPRTSRARRALVSELAGLGARAEAARRDALTAAEDFLRAHPDDPAAVTMTARRDALAR